MNRLIERVALLSAAKQARVVKRVEQQVQLSLPGTRVETDGGRVTVSGPAVLRRFLAEPSLRFFWSSFR